MIPKKIHYCWFGRGQMTELARSCIKSWKKYLPDYELILWNEDNFDITMNRYVKEAYEAKKYAFVTDFVRLYAIYHHGGIYMDTDVEVLKSLDRFLEHRAFTGCESKDMCVTGIMAAEKGHIWIETLLNDYNDKLFLLTDGSYNMIANTHTITEITIKQFGWIEKSDHQYLSDGLNIYPFDFFCAKDWKTGKVKSTKNTYTIHHFSGSWHTKADKLKNKMINIIGPSATQILVNLKRKIKRC